MKKGLLWLFTILLVGFWFGGISLANTTVSDPYWSISYTLNGDNETQYEAKFITIYDWDTTITILDRNLWATSNVPGSSNSYWFHFQRWNNYWFNPTTTPAFSTTRVSANSITLPYSSNVFIKGSENDNWLDDNNKVDLWWWSTGDWGIYSALTEEQAELRQWPCPEWFHVPTAWELSKMIELMWTNSWEIHNKLKIPYNNLRSSYDGTISNNWTVYLWSSSPNPSENSESSRAFYMWYDGSRTDPDMTYNMDRSEGCWIRCFYNQYTEYWASAPTEITEINISWITDPIAWATATTGWLTITSTPANAIIVYTGDYNRYPQYPRWVAYNATASLPGSTPGYACQLYNNADEIRCRPTFLNGASAPTYYYLRIIYSPKDWYVMSDDYTVTANNSYGEILTWSGTDGYGNPNDSYYVRIKYLPTDIPNASTEISTINITGPESVTDWADWLHDWTISTTDNTYTKSNYLPVEWNGTAWVDGTHESVPAWYTVWFKVTLTPNEGYVFAENPVINYNWTAWTNSGHTFLSGNILYIDLWTVPTSSPTSTIYTITLWTVSNWTITASTGAATSWTEITLTATPASNYNFWSWTVKDADNNSITVTDNKFAMPASNVTVTATFTAKSTWLGWGGKTVKKDTTNTDTDKTTEKEDTDNDVPLAIENNSDTPIYEQWDQSEILSNWYTREFNNAYRFWLKYGITTMDDINKADMHGPLTRIAMDKMLVNYAINVLHMVPDTTREVPNFPDIDEKLNEEYGNAVTLWYQLWIMWINITEFRPFDEVPRADFGTSLWRMLFGLEDGEGLYYEPHLKKLKEKWIITNDNPNLQELRGYVMLMLMRSAMKK